MTKTAAGFTDRVSTAEENKDTVDRKEYTTTIEVNGARIYHEVRGSGPSVLFIAGATGDGGHFQRVAEPLSDEFTVVTYDRRANSRSPRPEGWQSTSTEEQSDDAAALIEALGLAPAVVFGASGGAIIGLDLVVRHPGLLRGAILHEPAMLSVLDNPEQVMGAIQQVVEGGMQKGGPRAGMEAFLRFFVGDRTFENLDVGLRERMLGNAETFFGLELASIGSHYQPDEAALAYVEVPVVVMTGTESPPLLIETSRWLASRLNVELDTLPGAHAPYFDRPGEMAQALRPLLRKLSG
ncbi:MAG TPA: alpha/beta hydrolase [Rubrobacteraceae bacterium]|nr:alpha/beta hydrolase [Rubrobacteraceae bacterium]